MLVVRLGPSAAILLRRINRGTRLRYTGTPSARNIAVMRREPRKGPGSEQFVDPAHQRRVVVIDGLSQTIDARARRHRRSAHCRRSESDLSVRLSIALRSGALIFRTSELKIALCRELSDLGVQPLDLPLVLGFAIPPDVRVEVPRGLVLKLPLPGVNLVRMDLIPLGQTSIARTKALRITLSPCRRPPRM